MNGAIDFSRIKPHRGDQRRAFEEMVFQLFSREHSALGEPVRREGAGGDRGLEGYISDQAGRVLIAVQAKFFVEAFGRSQWQQVDTSVRIALAGNAEDKALRRYIIATPRTFTESQQGTWRKFREEWAKEATALGYPDAPAFEHWDASRLIGMLLREENRGQYLYWFNYADFDSCRCARLSAIARQELQDRYVPQLHTRTRCEELIHRFLRSEWSRQEYCQETRRLVPPAAEGAWRAKADWPPDLRPLVDEAKRRWDIVMSMLGEGTQLPDSIRGVQRAAHDYDQALWALWNAYRESLRLQDGSGELESPTSDESSIEQKCLRDMGERASLAGWAHMFSDLGLVYDCQSLLVLGEAGCGKTHTLAEVCTRFEESGGVALFVEGRKFFSQEDPWTQFLRWADFPGGVRDFLECFSAMAAAIPLPGLICIDALNESPRRGLWLHGLQGFAAELEKYRNLKLLVSCRSDFAELTIPDPVRQTTAVGWGQITHGGLGLSVLEALPKYLHAFRVRGLGVPPLSKEFENPLLLRTFCEAFEDEEVPAGSRTLPAILRRYAARKAKNIHDRIGCRADVVLTAIRDLAATVLAVAEGSLPESRVRQLLTERHPATEEHLGLYAALRSEGIIHEVVRHDALGPVNKVRFTYQKVWDFFLGERLLPFDTAPGPDLRGKIASNTWRRDHPNLLGLFAIRLPEEGNGELHDLAGVAPGADCAVDRAFLDSISWRTRRRDMARTHAILDQLTAPGGAARSFGLLLPIAPNENHPWNAEHLHGILAGLPLAERDRTWTLWLNAQFCHEANESAPARLIRLAESEVARSAPAAQAFLLATALAWLSSSTAVKERRRIAVALGRLVRDRREVAARLVERFSDVNDPYVLEAVLYAAAAAALQSPPRDPGLERLAAAAHDAVFGAKRTLTHLLIRHYAQVVCEQALAKGMLPRSISAESFRPPYDSEWPDIPSEAEIKRIKAQVDRDYEGFRALSAVIESTRTVSDAMYGDWGRYTMGWMVCQFQSRRRKDQKPLRKSAEGGFDDRIARRYVIGRVIALGLDGGLDDQTPDRPYEGRKRPSYERLGKKYQWIGLYEFLGLLSDRYHMTGDYEGEVRLFTSAAQLDPPDLLDPLLLEPRPPDPRADLRFVAKPQPWWAPYVHPFPRPLSDERRRPLVARSAVDEPTPLLRLYDGADTWLALAAYFEYHEPVPCFCGRWESEHAVLSWSLNSYAVPRVAFRRFVSAMLAPRLDNNMLPDAPGHRSDLAGLVTYPEGADDTAMWCARTFAKTDGAWFTTCNYESGHNDLHRLSGVIPSPQLGTLLRLRWRREGLDFVAGDGHGPIAQYLCDEEHNACLVRSDSLRTVFADNSLRLVWRVYGWKWISTHRVDTVRSREYWVLYTLTEDNQVKRLGGGTWILEPHAKPEALPWHARPGQKRGQKRRDQKG